MGAASSILRNCGRREPKPSDQKKDHLPSKSDEITKPTTDDNEETQTMMEQWEDEYGNNCIMICPRGMSITWGEDKRYWSYRMDKDEESAIDPEFEVVELLNICWLEIHGKLGLSHLNLGVTYEAFFEIKLAEDNYGWHTPVDLRLKLPQGRVEERKENLDEKPKNRWLLLKVGDIQPVDMEQNGDAVISLFQYATHWKKGLIIKGILIIPKDDDDFV